MPILPLLAPRTEYFSGFVKAMYDNSIWQLDQQQFAAAVLLSQVAVEMGARNAFTSLVVRRVGPINDRTLKLLLPDMSFMDVATRRLWTELTGGDSVTKPKPVWKAYQKHVEGRNRIAHGLASGDSFGLESVAAAGAFIGRLDAAMDTLDRGPGL